MPGTAGDDSLDLIRIGTVGKPHGVRGGIYVDGAVDAAAMTAGLEIRIGEDEFVVASRAGTDGRPIISVEGVSDRNAAEPLRGRLVFARRADLTPLSEGEWYASDLEGMEVVSASADVVGSVVQLKNNPSADLLVVSTGGQQPLLVPMIRDAILGIDSESRRITIDTAFLGLDEPGEG